MPGTNPAHPSIGGSKSAAISNMMASTFEDVMGFDLIAGVDEILGRKVIAFLSANHIDPDIAVETFILAQRPSLV